MKNLPTTIKLSILLILVSQALGLLNDYLNDELTFPIWSNFIIITSLAYLSLAYNISLKQNWARIIITIFYAIEILLFFDSLYDIGFEVMSIGDTKIKIVLALKKFLQVSILIILFGRTSNKWFNSGTSPDNSQMINIVD